MAFQRALWHSGLTYQQICCNCHTLVRYMDDKLDFRPWYPDGFVYCPKCRNPLRHSETFAINADGTYANAAPPGAAPLAPVTPIINGVPAAIPPLAPAQVAPQAPAPVPVTGAAPGNIAYCSKCGRQYNVGENNFCFSCGNKLVN